MKKLMLLGGSAFLLKVIEIAHNMGIFVITCDYLPNNVAHKYSDMYVNVSILDKDAVLKAAKELQIDGIMSFACDPGVVTAAYVAEKMGLPTIPYEASIILQNKNLFRKFLLDNRINAPKFKSFDRDSFSINDIDGFFFPVIVKPVDSAGSKGVTKVDDIAQIDFAIKTALENSHCNSFIIEEFVELEGYQSTFDCFAIDGKLVFNGFSDQQFDNNASNVFTPQGGIFPTNSMPLEAQQQLTNDLQNVITLLNIKTSIFNVESRLGKNGKAYLMEVSPRAGGNEIAELLDYAYQQHLIENNIRYSLRMDLYDMHYTKPNGYYCYYAIHSLQEGVFVDCVIDNSIQSNVLKLDLFVSPGEKVYLFSGANKALGIVLLKFNTYKEASLFFENPIEFIKVVLQ